MKILFWHYFKGWRNLYFDAAKLATGTLAAQIINLISLPFLARLFSSQDFGSLAVFHAVATIGLSVASLRMELALVGLSAIEAKNRLVQALLLLNIILGVLFILLVGGWQYWSGTLGDSHLLILFFYFICVANSLVLDSFLNSVSDYTSMSFGKLIQAISFSGFGLLLGFLSWDEGLLLATMGSAMAQFGFLLAVGIKHGLIWKDFPNPITAMRSHWQFVYYSTPASLLDAFASRLVIVGLALFFSNELTGAWFMAERIVLIPLAILGGVVSRVVFQDFSEKKSDGKLEAKHFYSIWRVLALLGAIPLAVLVLWGDRIIPFFLGPAWTQAGEIAALMSVWGYVSFVSSSTSSGFIVLSKQQFTPVFNFIRLAAIVALFAITSKTGNFYLFLYGFIILETVRSVVRNMTMIHLVKTQKNA